MREGGGKGGGEGDGGDDSLCGGSRKRIFSSPFPPLSTYANKQPSMKEKVGPSREGRIEMGKGEGEREGRRSIQCGKLGPDAQIRNSVKP